MPRLWVVVHVRVYMNGDLFAYGDIWGEMPFRASDYEYRCELYLNFTVNHQGFAVCRSMRLKTCEFQGYHDDFPVIERTQSWDAWGYTEVYSYTPPALVALANQPVEEPEPQPS